MAHCRLKTGELHDGCNESGSVVGGMLSDYRAITCYMKCVNDLSKHFLANIGEYGNDV